MSKVKLEETNGQRRLHIGSFFTDLNESDYQELVKIFSNATSDGVSEVISKLVRKEPITDEDKLILKKYHEALPVIEIKRLQHDEYFISSSKAVVIKPMDKFTCYAPGVNVRVLDFK